jgi:cysteine desulfurase
VNSNDIARIYLDYAATTPIDPRVRAAVDAVREDAAFNAASPHAEGRRARAVLDTARERVARALHAPRRAVVFTSGGTEANNLALLGVAKGAPARRHIVTTVIEHHSVLRAAEALEAGGFAVTRVRVDSAGFVDPAEFASALRPDTLVASAMYANNEIGTVQPIEHLSALAHERGALFHTDAVAAAGWLPLDVEALGIDLLSLSAHKFYGPRGAGALYVREGTPLEPLIYGGGQELGRRSGTEDVLGAAGLAEALGLAERDRGEAVRRVQALRNRLEAAVAAGVPDVRINGSAGRRLPNIASFTFSQTDAAALVMLLDLGGIAASAGSACTSGSLEPSHVIAALGGEEDGATIRFSLGRTTTDAEIDRVVAAIPEIVKASRTAEST